MLYIYYKENDIEHMAFSKIRNSKLSLFNKINAFILLNSFIEYNISINTLIYNLIKYKIELKYNENNNYYYLDDKNFHNYNAELKYYLLMNIILFKDYKVINVFFKNNKSNINDTIVLSNLIRMYGLFTYSNNRIYRIISKIKYAKYIQYILTNTKQFYNKIPLYINLRNEGHSKLYYKYHIILTTYVYLTYM